MVQIDRNLRIIIAILAMVSAIISLNPLLILFMFGLSYALVNPAAGTPHQQKGLAIVGILFCGLAFVRVAMTDIYLIYLYLPLVVAPILLLVIDR